MKPCLVFIFVFYLGSLLAQNHCPCAYRIKFREDGVNAQKTLLSPEKALKDFFSDATVITKYAEGYYFVSSREIIPLNFSQEMENKGLQVVSTERQHTGNFSPFSNDLQHDSTYSFFFYKPANRNISRIK